MVQQNRYIVAFVYVITQFDILLQSRASGNWPIEIKAASGTHFDTEAVELFLKALQKEAKGAKWNWSYKLIVEIERAKRYSETVSMVMLDIDNFAQYNEVNGHISADYVL